MPSRSTPAPALSRAGIVLAVLFAALFAARALPALAAAPTVLSVTPNSGSTAGGTAVVVSGSGFGTSGSPLVTSVTVGGTAATSFSVVDDSTLNVTTPAHTAGLVDVVVSTADGPNTNTTGDNFTYVAPGPAITSISPTSGPSGTIVTFTGTNFTGATTVSFGGSTVAPFNVTSTTLQAQAPAHAAGTVNTSVTTPDGTSADTAADDYLYTAAAPAVTGLSPTGGSTAGGTIVTITGTGFTGATLVTFGGTPGTSLTVNGDTSITVTSPAHAAGSVDVIVTTPSGPSANTTADNYLYGTVAPSVTGLNPAGGSVAGGTVVTVTGSGFSGATSVTFGGVAGTSLNVSNDSTLTVVAPAHAAGTVDVLVTTPAGTSTNTAADNYVYGAAAPTITSVSPTAGPLAGGNTVTITGTGFTGATGVTFGGIAGTSVTVVSDVSLTVVAPAHGAGLADIIVTTPLGSNTNTASDNYTYSAAPFISSVSPGSGPITGGTIVTITGSQFTGVTAVSFGGTAATAFTLVSDSQITATAPAHAAGTVDIVVTTANGASANSTADDFVYGSGPAITSISPTNGPTAGGTTVTITGTGFTGATAVMFGSVAATSFTVVSDTQITAVSPAQANSVVQVKVTTPIGTSADVAADNFTYGSGTTVTFTLYFRWTLIVWNGKQNADITTALKGQENPDNPATNDVSGLVTAIFHYNNPLQKFEGFFPGSAGVPGANDFTTFKQGEAYWIAVSASGTTTWTTLGD